MGDFKKTLFAGMLVVLVLLLTPYYLQLIGYQSLDDQGLNELAPVDSVLDVAVEPLSPPILKDFDRVVSVSENIKEFIITTDKYFLRLSTLGGGSFNEFTLNDLNRFALLGGYSEGGVYNDSSRVSLILNNNQDCAPCVLLNSGSDDTLLNVPFSVREVLLNGLVSNKELQNYSLGPFDTLDVVLDYSLGGFLITKKTTFFGNNYLSSHSLFVEGESSSLPPSLALVWNKGLRYTEKNLTDELTYAASSVSVDKSVESLTFSPSHLEDQHPKQLFNNRVDWVAVRNKYFIMAIIPEVSSFGFSHSSAYLLNESLPIVPCYGVGVGTRGGGRFDARLYLGPLDIDYINELDTSLDRIMNFGWFVIQPFSRGVLWLLKIMHSTGLNYGIILILFAFLVRIITGPLTKKSFASSQKMQSVQPKLKKIQERFKKDSQRLNQETVKLYKENQVNPLGGCLPMLLQMPLLFSLFLVFRSTIEFRGAPFFGWISNLSQPDTIFNLPFYVPIYGDQVALLPFLLGISMFLSQRVSMATMDPKQKPIMYIMTAFFFLIFNSFPSGLNLYYLVYNLLNYQQQKSLKKT